MRVLIVGGLGYIGFEVAKHLSEDHVVFVLDRSQHRTTLAVRHNIHPVVDGVENAAQYPGFFKSFDVIVNLTGGMDDANLNTVLPSYGTQACAAAYVKHVSDARVVHISTQYVYSDPSLNKERSNPAPKCAYGVLHAMAEQAVQDDIILRFGTVWGLATHTRYDTWGNHFKRLIDEGQPIDINYPDSILCLLHISTAVSVIDWALSNGSGVYNVADKQGYQEDLAKEFCRDTPITNRKFVGGYSQGMDCSRIMKAGFMLGERELTW